MGNYLKEAADGCLWVLFRRRGSEARNTGSLTKLGHSLALQKRSQRAANHARPAKQVGVQRSPRWHCTGALRSRYEANRQVGSLGQYS